MARYIDAELLIENIVKIEDLRTLSTKTIGKAISDTPTADVVEVVRCKDCKYQDECLQKVDCEYVMKEIVFCSYGERKEK